MSSEAAGRLEDASCPMCGSNARVTVYRFPPYGVVRCGVCRFHYLSPRLVEQAMLELYRSGDYFEGGEMGYDSYEQQEVALRATYRRLVRQLARAGYTGGALLEVGCGYGFLLDEARETFSSVTGTEYSAAAVKAARSRGLEVISGGPRDIPAGRTYDLIVAAHVVEHVYQPRAFVGELRALLRPGGRLLLGTPDMGSGWRRLMGRRWPSFKIPEHVTYFDSDSLGRLLSEAGLHDVRAFPFLHAFPLALIARKLGLGFVGRRVGQLGSKPVWLPATTLAVAGRRPLSEGAPAPPA